MTRQRLPDRRPNVSVDVDYRGHPLAVTVGFDEAGEPREVFANGAREGSDMQHVLADACVVVSIALQNGISAAALRHSLGTVPDWSTGAEREAPASPIGAILSVVEDCDAR